MSCGLRDFTVSPYCYLTPGHSDVFYSDQIFHLNGLNFQSHYFSWNSTLSELNYSISVHQLVGRTTDHLRVSQLIRFTIQATEQKL